MSADLTVKVWSPYEVYYEGPAESVTGVNKTGEFDVLPGHVNFFSILLPGKLVVRNGDDAKEFTFERGIIRVTEDRVTVFSNL